jgi:hypothetical protein
MNRHTTKPKQSQKATITCYCKTPRIPQHHLLRHRSSATLNSHDSPTTDARSDCQGRAGTTHIRQCRRCGCPSTPSTIHVDPRRHIPRCKRPHINAQAPSKLLHNRPHVAPSQRPATNIPEPTHPRSFTTIAIPHSTRTTTAEHVCPDSAHNIPRHLL